MDGTQRTVDGSSTFRPVRLPPCASMASETPDHGSARFKPFAYLAAPNAALYRRVMLAFVAAKRRFVVHLRGVRLRHHGDFDWGGLAIGNVLHRRLPVEPWQYDREAYLRAVSMHPNAAPLSGSPTSASWDSGLAAAMREAGRRIEEELVANDLLETFAR